MNFNETFSKGRIINLLLRILMLAIVVFLVLTYVPTTVLENNTKLLIALLVVVTYSVLDLMGASVAKTRDTMCDILC